MRVSPPSSEKRFSPLVARVEEGFEHFRLVQLAEDAPLLVGGQRGLGRGVLEALLQPAALDGVLYMHIFDAEVPAVDLLEVGDHLAELDRRGELLHGGGEFRVEVGLGEIEGGEGKRLGAGTVATEGIELRGHVPDVTVVIDDRVDAAGLLDERDAGALTGMNNAAPGGGVGLGGPKVEALEEKLPLGIHGMRIRLPCFVLMIDEFGGPGVDARLDRLDFRHGGGAFRRLFVCLQAVGWKGPRNALCLHGAIPMLRRGCRAAGRGNATATFHPTRNFCATDALRHL
jgi:hypothetical protein